MLSMIRCLFTVASAISLLLCVGWLLLWRVSIHRFDQLETCDGGYHDCRLISSAGQFLVLYEDDSALQAMHTPSHPAMPWQYNSFPFPQHFLLGTGSWLNRHGFAFEWHKRVPVMGGNGFRSFSAPVGRETLLQFQDWAAALFFAVLPAGWLLATRRRMKRRRLAGVRCPTCGYDLRASKTRCPECGTTIKANSSL